LAGRQDHDAGFRGRKGMSCSDQRRLKGNDFKSDPGDQVQDPGPDVGVLEIRGDHDTKVHVIGISVAVLIGKRKAPFPKIKRVMGERLQWRHDFNPGPAYE
jgi:hypothetical protein